MSHVGVQTRKTDKTNMTTDLKTNYDTEIDTSDVEKIKSCRKQNIEDEADDMQLDTEDTQRSNLE